MVQTRKKKSETNKHKVQIANKSSSHGLDQCQENSIPVTDNQTKITYFFLYFFILWIVETGFILLAKFVNRKIMISHRKRKGEHIGVCVCVFERLKLLMPRDC